MTDLISRAEAPEVIALAAALWREQAVDVGAPESVAAKRTPEEFVNQVPEVQGVFMKYARCAIRTYPAPDRDAIRAESLREAADAINKRGVQEEASFGLGRGTQNFYRARDLVRALIPAPASHGVTAGAVGARIFYIDCEFDGHRGPLLSIAMVRQDGFSLHVKVDAVPSDPWVIANVMPIMDSHNAHMSVFSPPNGVGFVLRNFIGEASTPIIVADSPVDIGRFCRAISTSQDGGWASADYSMMTFKVANVDCYPTDLEGAVQHNAWWDAMALRAALAGLGGGE